MSESHVRRDLDYLAGSLPHRGPNTEHERAAAQYLFDRFREYTPNVEMDDFYSPDTHAYLFASYYAEFLVVALLGVWLPWLGLAYGACVFLAYLAELTGYPLLARLLPQYETQNVAARFLGKRPERLIIVSANYDSGKTGPLSEPWVVPWLRSLHLVLVVCMMMVLLTCLLRVAAVPDNPLYAAAARARIPALVLLTLAAGCLAYGEMTGQFVRGAIHNAAGTAALLALAQRFQEEPVEEADVWLVATGSKESWLCGMRHFVASHRFDPDTTYFLNLSGVGAGSLRYTTGEGMLHLFRSSPELIDAAEAASGDSGARPYRHRGLPSDALIPLTRGYKALSIIGVDEHSVPPHWRRTTDTPGRVDYAALEKAAQYAEAIVRRVNHGTRESQSATG